MTTEGTRRDWKAIPTSKKEENSLMVKFSPEILQGFARVEEAVRDSKHFSPEILANLHSYASGKPMLVSHAITAIGFVASETMRHAVSTQDTEAKDALSDLLFALMEDEKRPIRLVKTVGKDR